MCFFLIIENRVFWIELWIPKPRCGSVGLVPGSCPIFDFWKNRWWCKFVNTPNSIFKKLAFNLYKARKRGYIQNRLKKSVCPIAFTHLWGTIKCPINKKDCFFSSRMDFINFWNLSPSSQSAPNFMAKIMVYMRCLVYLMYTQRGCYMDVPWIFV